MNEQLSFVEIDMLKLKSINYEQRIAIKSSVRTKCILKTVKK